MTSPFFRRITRENLPLCSLPHDQRRHQQIRHCRQRIRTSFSKPNIAGVQNFLRLCVRGRLAVLCDVVLVRFGSLEIWRRLRIRPEKIVVVANTSYEAAAAINSCESAALWGALVTCGMLVRETRIVKRRSWTYLVISASLIRIVTEPTHVREKWDVSRSGKLRKWWGQRRDQLPFYTFSPGVTQEWRTVAICNITLLGCPPVHSG